MISTSDRCSPSFRSNFSKLEDQHLKSSLSSVEKQVEAAIQSSPLRDRLVGFQVEADDDRAGWEFLRVTLQVKSLKGVDDADLVTVRDAIEHAIIETDERFPSVRFSTAA